MRRKIHSDLKHIIEASRLGPDEIVLLDRIYRNAMRLLGPGGLGASGPAPEAAALTWLTKDNSLFYNLTPVQMVAEGKGRRIIERQEELLGDRDCW